MRNDYAGVRIWKHARLCRALRSQESFGDFRFAACFLAALGVTRSATFFLLAFRLELFVDFFAELSAFRSAFALPRAAAASRITCS